MLRETWSVNITQWDHTDASYMYIDEKSRNQEITWWVLIVWYSLFQTDGQQKNNQIFKLWSFHKTASSDPIWGSINQCWSISWFHGGFRIVYEALGSQDSAVLVAPGSWFQFRCSQEQCWLGSHNSKERVALWIVNEALGCQDSVLLFAPMEFISNSTLPRAILIGESKLKGAFCSLNC